MRPSRLTASRLRALLDYDKDTGVFRWLIDKGRIAAGSEAGGMNAGGYVQICIDYRLYNAHRLAWLWTHGVWPDIVDHINGDRGDNRMANLREATHSQNLGNSRRPKDNTTGFKGVHRKRKRFSAEIQVNGKRMRLGVFDTPEKAHAAYIATATVGFGEFARAE